MAHRALTLKYRPQVFTDMVGQEHVSAVLARALETKRFAHAYLFTGARGVGKTTSARILAKALNCERRGAALAAGKPASPEPCNACTSCLEITSGVSLDVLEIDGASNRSIDNIRDLREKVRFMPTGGRYRVVIIDEVHQLSNDAFAALLKTLEEPPPHVVFIFATTDPQKVPETIRSRTQRFDFARVPLRKVADRLLDIARREAADPEGLRFTLSEGAAFLIAHKSEGSIRDAVSALDQVVSAGEPDLDEALVRRVLGIADREVFFTLGDAVVGRDPRAALHALHQAFDKGLDARDIAEGLAEHFRHVMILKVDPDGTDLVAASAEDVDRLRAQGKAWTEHDLLRLLRIVSDVLVPMRESPQPFLHLEAAVMQMATLESGETLAQLLGRLEALETRLSGGAAPEPARGPGGAGAGRTPASAPSGAPRSTPEVPRRSMPAGSIVGAHGGMRAAAAPPPVGAGGTRTPVAPPPGAGSVRTPAPPAGATSAAGAGPRAATAPRAAAPGVGLADPALEGGPEVVQQWAAFVATVRARKPMLGAFLEESRFVGKSAEAFLLATDDLHRVVIEESGNRAIVDEALKRMFGSPIVLTCVAPDTAPAMEATAVPPRDEATPSDCESVAGAPDPAAFALAMPPSPEASRAVAAPPPAPDKPIFHVPPARTREGEDVTGMIEKTIAWFDGEAISPHRPGTRRTEG